MKIGKLTAILLAILLSCSCKQSNKNAYFTQSDLTDQAVLSTNSQVDTLGPIILKIDFNIKVTGDDLKIYEDGYIHWINVDHPQIKQLVDADKIVLPFTKVKIVIDYPLKFPTTFEISTNGRGFSRKQLVTEISEKYHEIYKLEETSATTKTIPISERKGLMNRNQTDGKFGIWGHDISDLDLSQIEVHKNSSGQTTLTLGIES